jgi:hypothetical protein
MREKIAHLISNTLNPFVISVVIILLLAFNNALNTIDAIKWALISLALSVLPVFIAVIFLIRNKKMDGFFSTPREQRNTVYILASILGAIGCGLFWYLDAPELLKITFTSGFTAIVIFMVINYIWKISLHTAFTAAFIAVLIMVYGVYLVCTVLFLPLVAWARIELQQHSIIQITVGSLLAVIIVVCFYWGFGIIVI